MNEIMKDPHNIRKGIEWYDMMPEQLQERWMYYTIKANGKQFAKWKLENHETFKDFVFGAFLWRDTEEGISYWYDISRGHFGINQKKSLWSKIINFFKS